MHAFAHVNGLDVASPCKASWNAIKGDNRARHFALCEKNVYNISAMTAKEVTDLVERTEDKFCGRLDRRREGSKSSRLESAAKRVRRNFRRLERLGVDNIRSWGTNRASSAYIYGWGDNLPDATL